MFEQTGVVSTRYFTVISSNYMQLKSSFVNPVGTFLYVKKLGQFGFNLWTICNYYSLSIKS